MVLFLRAAALTTVALLTLSACGDESGPGTAVDPTPTGSPSPTPTAEPTVGSYPSFEPEDYVYTLKVSCFCADAGVPVRVTVTAGEVTDAVYARSGRGVGPGDPVPEYRRLTINDVIDAANDTEADSVQVTWPDGQDYPTSVHVDPDQHAMDEEIGYEVSDVTVA